MGMVLFIIGLVAFTVFCLLAGVAVVLGIAHGLKFGRHLKQHPPTGLHQYSDSCKCPQCVTERRGYRD